MLAAVAPSAPPGAIPRPRFPFAPIRDHVAFHPSRMDRCTVGGVATARADDICGGWITPNLRGPFKGGPGAAGW